MIFQFVYDGLRVGLKEQVYLPEVAHVAHCDQVIAPILGEDVGTYLCPRSVRDFMAHQRFSRVRCFKCPAQAAPGDVVTDLL